MILAYAFALGIRRLCTKSCPLLFDAILHITLTLLLPLCMDYLLMKFMNITYNLQNQTPLLTSQFNTPNFLFFPGKVSSGETWLALSDGQMVKLAYVCRSLS